MKGEYQVINIENWMETFIAKLNETFENRVWFVGLQGSYGRGEATNKAILMLLLFWINWLLKILNLIAQCWILSPIGN